MDQHKCDNVNRFLNILFDRGESINVCTNVTNTQWIKLSDFKEQFISSVLPNFVCVNPVSATRSDSNVNVYRNLIFECDSLPIEQQLDIIRQSELPFSTCVYSGNKSYHYIISLDTPLISEETYRLAWRRIYAKLELVAGKSNSPVFDPSTKNPSRLSRFPFALRDEVEQSLIECNGRIPYKTFVNYLNTCPEIETQAEFTAVGEILPGREGQLSLRSSHFLRTGKDYKGQGWHTIFLLTAKDLKAQGFSFREAQNLLEGVTGNLDESHDIPQLEYAYADSSFEMEHRADSKLRKLLLDSYRIFNLSIPKITC